MVAEGVYGRGAEGWGITDRPKRRRRPSSRRGGEPNIPVAEIIEAAPVVVFSAPDCPYCDEAKAALHEAGVAFTEVTRERRAAGAADEADGLADRAPASSRAATRRRLPRRRAGCSSARGCSRKIRAGRRRAGPRRSAS